MSDIRIDSGVAIETSGDLRLVVIRAYLAFALPVSYACDGQGNVGDGLDLCQLQYPQIGLPLAELIKWIVVGAEVLRQPALASNGAVKHPTECDTIDRAGMDAEPNDPARVLIHDHQDPVGPQRCRLAPEQIQTPEAVFHVAQES